MEHGADSEDNRSIRRRPIRFKHCTSRADSRRFLMIFKGLKERIKKASDEKDNGDPVPRSRMIDSSSVRAHRCAAGSLKDSEPRETGRSRGERPTKTHAMADGKGGLRRRRMRLSPGQAADRAGAAALLDGLAAGGVLIAGKAYDADAVLKRIATYSGSGLPGRHSVKTEPQAAAAAG